MGVPLTIFSLHELRNEGAGCRHYLLLRVGQPAFGNADAGEHDHAVRVADEKRSALIEAWQAETLARECAVPHAVSLVGELQARPPGDELSEGRGGCLVDLWVAETRFGHPWVVMGTAESGAAFWREVEADDDLSRLDALGPAARLRAYFLTDDDD